MEEHEVSKDITCAWDGREHSEVAPYTERVSFVQSNYADVQ